MKKIGLLIIATLLVSGHSSSHANFNDYDIHVRNTLPEKITVEIVTPADTNRVSPSYGDSKAFMQPGEERSWRHRSPVTVTIKLSSGNYSIRTTDTISIDAYSSAPGKYSVR